MRYKIGRNPVYRAPVPALIGGINTAASSDIVGDNQLSNSLNMMAMDGILRTRPGFKISDDEGYAVLQSNAKNIKKYDFSVESDGEYGKMVSVWREGGVISFFHCRKDGGLISAGEIETGGEIINELTVTSSDGLYCFVTVDISEEDGTEATRNYAIYKLSEEEWAKLSDDDIHIPVVAENCTTPSAETLAPKFNGDFILGFNLISNKYKVKYTAFNEMLLVDYHFACYPLPFYPPVGTTVKVEITDSNDTTSTHTIKINQKGGYNVEDEKGESGFFVTVTYDRFYFCATKRDENGEPIVGIGFVTGFPENETDTENELNAEKPMYLPGYNNITVTAEYEPDEEAKKRIFSATCAAWYGGNRGIASGTRLFIGGMEGKYKNVLQWSDLSNPLYFPENCNSEVGDPSQGITAFGKQADLLVIFKPYEIHAASYVLNESEIEDAALDFISDLTVTTAVFPLTQISAETGCDCPGTIQLCRNRLCWAHSNGKVYTLVSSSQYNEKNIYELSEPIKRVLSNLSTTVLKKATSADWDGYYVLSAGEHIFLMQYESYGYSRIYSYTSEEAASHKLPWFYLNTPYKPEFVICVDNHLMTVSKANETGIVLHYADRDSVNDDVADLVGAEFSIIQRQIRSMVQSKIFDFSRPEIKRVICHILTEIGGTSGNSIKLSAVTDRSRLEDTVDGVNNSPINMDEEYTLEGSSIITPLPETITKTIMRISDSASAEISINRIRSAAPDFFRMIRVNPGIFGVRRFAVRIESEGAFSLGQVCIEYKMLGSVN